MPRLKPLSPGDYLNNNFGPDAGPNSAAGWASGATQREGPGGARAKPADDSATRVSRPSPVGRPAAARAAGRLALLLLLLS